MPPALVLGQLDRVDAFAVGAVEVLRPRDPRLLRRLDPGLGQGIARAVLRDRQRTGTPPVAVLAPLVALHPPEIGQHPLVVPAAGAELRPVVVVPAVAADEDHGVDGAAAAQPLAGRPDVGAAGDRRVRLGLEAPVEVGVLHRPDVRRRDPGEGVLVALAGFQQQDVELAVLGQPAGHGPAGGAAADHDQVVGLSAVAGHQRFTTSSGGRLRAIHSPLPGNFDSTGPSHRRMMRSLNSHWPPVFTTLSS